MAKAPNKANPVSFIKALNGAKSEGSEAGFSNGVLADAHKVIETAAKEAGTQHVVALVQAFDAESKRRVRSLKQRKRELDAAREYNNALNRAMAFFEETCNPLPVLYIVGDVNQYLADIGVDSDDLPEKWYEVPKDFVPSAD